MAYRSSTGNLTHYDDPGPGPGPAQRWDRDKFERYSRRGGPPDESFHFEERDRYGPRGNTRTLEIDIDERAGRSHAPPPRPRYIDDMDDHRGFRRRPTDFLEEPTPTEVANRALAPYRGPPQYDAPRPARPARPQYIRRQSSLDTFDRKSYPRYGDHEREFRPPVGVPIPLPVRSDRSRSSRPYEEDFEEIRYRDADPRYEDYEEDYRDIHIHRSRSRRRRASPSHKSRKSSPSPSSSESSRSPSPSVKSTRSHKTSKSAKTNKTSKSHKSHKSSRSHRSKSTHRTTRTSRTRSSSSSSSSFTEVEAELPGKKGKTKMPKRLVHIKAVEELGYPYDEEDDFIFVHRALGKEQIDEVIKISETYKNNNTTTTYKYEKETDIIEVPPPPSSVTSASTHHTGHHTSHTIHPPPPASVASHRTSRSRAHSHAPPPPPPPVIYQPSHHGGTVYDEHIEESRHVHGPLTVLSPEAQYNHNQQLVRRRSESEIREDIRNLEIERRTIRDERERDFREYELVPVKDPPRDVVRVEKDRKVRPNPKLVAAMMSTLT